MQFVGKAVRLTYNAALNNAQKAYQLWIDTAKEFGDPVPELKGHRLMYA